jgi:hypothetical protein
VASRVKNFDLQGHLPDRMGGTAEAGVIEADAMFDAVEDALGHLTSLDVVLGDLFDGAVHGQVVLAGGDDQVYPL